AGDQEHGDQEVGQWAREEDPDPLQRMLGMEPVRLLEVAGLPPAHADIAEDREGPDGIGGAAPDERKKLWTGADRELDHPHLEQLGREEMAAFVGCDQDQEHSADADRDQEPVEQGAHVFSLPEFAFTYS